MKNLLFILSTILLLSSCNGNCNGSGTAPVEIKSSAGTPLKVIYLMAPVEQGLHKIEINDSTTILLYRGTESCTMIEIK